MWSKNSKCLGTTRKWVQTPALPGTSWGTLSNPLTYKYIICKIGTTGKISLYDLVNHVKCSEQCLVYCK